MRKLYSYLLFIYHFISLSLFSCLFKQREERLYYKGNMVILGKLAQMLLKNTLLTSNPHCTEECASGKSCKSG